MSPLFSRSLATLMALLWLALSAFAGPKTVAGPYHVEVLTAPSMVSLGKGQLLITVTDASGKPLEGLSVQIIICVFVFTQIYII